MYRATLRIPEFRDRPNVAQLALPTGGQRIYSPAKSDPQTASNSQGLGRDRIIVETGVLPSRRGVVFPNKEEAIT
jgi:hypothetical protein